MLCRKYQVPFVINDNVEIAWRWMRTASMGQTIWKRERSGKSWNQIRSSAFPAKCRTGASAKKHGANYWSRSHLSTGTKKDADAVTPGMLAKICQAVDIPVVAIGGLNKEHLELLKGTGVDGIAVVSALFAVLMILKRQQRN